MRLIIVNLAIVMLMSSAHASISEKPLKLNQQDNPEPTADDSYFPPATEPYTSPMTETYRVETPGVPAVQNAPMNNSYNSNISVGGYAQSSNAQYPATREVLEAAADKCDEELAMLWQQQNNLESYRRPHFQKCIGEAKTRCDALKKLVIAIKRADEQLFSYQQAVKNAQMASAG